MSVQLLRLLDEMNVKGELRERFQTLFRQQQAPEKIASSDANYLAHYRDLGRIGVGGMAVVQRVQDPHLNRHLAMKIIKEDILHSAAIQSRFVNEAQTLAQLQHPNIVPVHELGQLDDGRYYFTMQEIKGEPLSTIIAAVHQASNEERWESSTDGWTLRRLLNIFTDICAAVSFAHSRGVIHRDLKPENILIGSFGQVLVVDWGIAKIIGQSSTVEEPVQILDRNAHQTRMGVIAGTPAYMAPEQARGQVDLIDERTDVYALGAILYEILSGRSPYSGSSHQQVLSRVLVGPPPSVRQTMLATLRLTETIELEHFQHLDDAELTGSSISDDLEDSHLPLPDELVQACEKAMHRLQDSRFASVEELRVVIQEWIDGAKRRGTALRVVEEALQTDTTRQKLLAEAQQLSEQAQSQLKNYPSWANEQQLAPIWTLQDKAAQLQSEADLLHVKREQLLQASLTHKADLLEAHVSLIQHYMKIHRSAEKQGDTETAACTAPLIKKHQQAIHNKHPAYLESAKYLAGNGYLSLNSNPAGAKVFMAAYEMKNRRLQPGPEKLVGVTPIDKVPIAMGTYQLRIQCDGFHDVVYPIDIKRQQHWDGVAPSGQAKPILLPPIGELGDDDCYVPSGYFICGNDSGVPVRLPTGKVWVDGFIVRRYSITNREIIAYLNDLSEQGLEEQVAAAIPCPRSAQGDIGHSCFARNDDGTFYLVADEQGVVPELDYPVVMISWPQAAAYAQWISKKTGKAWRLLNEFEWSKAARGVDGRLFPWGNEFTPSWCCMDVSKPVKGLEVVTSRPQDCSPYGVTGMSGHVFDWTTTPFDPEPKLPVDGSYTEMGGDGSGQTFVFRGGSWHSLKMFSHSAMRWCFPSAETWPMLGFRIGRSYTSQE